MDGICAVLLQNLFSSNLHCFVRHLFCYFVANYALSIWRKTKPKFFLWRKSDKYDVWIEVSEIISNWPYYLFHDLCEFSTLSCPLSDYDWQMHIVFVLSSHSSRCTTPKYSFNQRQLIWQ